MVDVVVIILIVLSIQLSWWKYLLELVSFLTQCTLSRRYEECWVNYRRTPDVSRGTEYSTFTQVHVGPIITKSVTEIGKLVEGQ